MEAGQGDPSENVNRWTDGSLLVVRTKVMCWTDGLVAHMCYISQNK
jgi:hypothetical protein